MTDGHHPGRSAAVVVLLLIGTLLTPVALAAHWARDTITSTDGYVAAVDELAADPALRAALVDELTTAALEQIDVDARLAAAVEPVVRDGIMQVVDSDAFRTVWSQANRTAHTALVALLTRDGGETLDLAADGQVSLDLGPIVDQARADLVARGVPLAESIPQVDVSVPLFTSQELVKARSAYTVLDAVADWLPWVVALALLGAIALARSRAVVLAWAAVAVVASTALVSLALVAVRDSYLGSLGTSSLRSQVTVAAADLLGDSMLGALRVGYAVGAVFAVAAVAVWLVSRLRGQPRSGEPSSRAAAVRQR